VEIHWSACFNRDRVGNRALTHVGFVIPDEAAIQEIVLIVA
jgi:hypothetical protein